MRERDELPPKVGLRKQLHFDRVDLRHGPDDAARLRKRAIRFLVRQAGRPWHDVWPDLDALLRKGDEHREVVARVRRDLLDAAERGRLWYRRANLRIVAGVLIAEMMPPRRPAAVPTYSAAELTREPRLIERWTRA